MRLALHTVICCCVFTTVLPLVKGTTGEPNTSLKRYRVCLQRRMKRDPQSSSETDEGQYADILVEPQEDAVDVVSPPSRSDLTTLESSLELNTRPRRATSSRCFLVTCSYSVLLDTLSQLSKNESYEKAPAHKIGSNGYGRRRRRSLQDVTRLALLTGRQRRSTEAASKANLAADIEDNP